MENVSLTQDDVVRILNLLDQSTYEELDLQLGDFRLTVSKSARNHSIAPMATAVPPTAAPGPTLPDASTRNGAAAPAAPPRSEAPAPPAVIASQPAPDAAGLLAIKSPMLGTFYRAPKPGAPPFVEVGSKVTESDTVCLIEVMKTYTTVPAGVRGRVARICAENTNMVEHQQILFLIEPE